MNSPEPDNTGAPEVDQAAFVHPTAALVGNVRIGARVYVGPHASIRADEPGPDGTVAPIVVEPEANLQDGVVLHALGGSSVVIGRGVSVAHGAVVHGPCRVGAGSFIGFNSVVFDAELGENVMIMHGALVEGVTVPAGLYVPSMATMSSEEDIQNLEKASDSALAFADKVRRTNVHLARSKNVG